MMQIRTAKFAFLSAVLFAALSPAGAQSAPNSLKLEGRIAGAGATRDASLHLLCNPDVDGGAVSLELWVPQAFKLKDFDYDDFEGPDAVAASRSLSRVSVGTKERKTEIVHAAAGWYSGEDPDTFVFGLNQRSHRPGKLADLLKGIDAKHTQLTWVQSAYDKSKRELHAVFALDPALVRRIHDTVDVCLARK